MRVQNKHQIFFQRIVYEYLPKLFYHYGYVGHVATTCSLKVNVETHVDIENQEKGAGKQHIADNIEGKLEGEHSSPLLNVAGHPRFELRRDLLSIIQTVPSFRRRCGDLGHGQRGLSAGHGVPVSLVEDGWTVGGNAK